MAADAQGTASLTPSPTTDPIAYWEDQIRKISAELESGNFKGDAEVYRKALRNARNQLGKAHETEASGDIGGATETLDPFAARTPEDQARLDAALGIVDPNALHQYGENDPQRVIGENEQISANALDSAWGDSASAYDPLRSGFEGLQYSEDALADMGKGAGYFERLMNGGGRDAVSEAEYGRRVADAEQIRRGQTEASLAAEEARGGSSAGQRVLAEQAASSGQVADTYRAGLDANAMAQKRRDLAGQTFFDMSKGIGDTRYNADYDTASGLDTFGLNKAGGQDAFTSSKNVALDNVARSNEAARLDAASYNADKQTGAADMNIDRAWGTGDMNVDTWNSATMGNAANRAAGTNAWLGTLGLQGDQALGQGALDVNRSNARTTANAQPTDLERSWGMITQTAGAAGDVVGALPRKSATRRGA